MEFRQHYRVLFVGFFTTLLAFVRASNFIGHDSEIGLLNYMARSNALLQEDPARSLNCFNKYIPLINGIAQNYETNFQACLTESEAAGIRADEATLAQRNDLANAAEASCELLKQCEDVSYVQGILQCYIDGGSANIQTMYVMNANASQELAALRQQYYLIQNEEYKCTNETKRVYEKESAIAYAGLNNCILGAEIVTDAPTTVTKETTTAKPLTTTKIPETTETSAEETTTEDLEESSSENSDIFY